MECGATSRDGALLLLCSNWGTDGSGSEVRAFITTGDGAASAAEDVCVAGGTAVLLPLREMVVAMMLDDGN